MDNSRLQVVADLVDPALRLWDQQLIRRHFDELSANLILHQSGPTPDGTDQLIWALDPRGCFLLSL